MPLPHASEHGLHPAKALTTQSIGFGVGLGVGKAVGLAVGFAVGLAVGPAVGEAVGLGVGLGVGHADVLQTRSWLRGQALPPCAAWRSTVTRRRWLPPPHECEHALQA